MTFKYPPSHVINVKDYVGIDLTGTTNSDTAFQAILAAAAASTGTGNVEVYIPPGTLSLTTRLTVGAGVTIRGAGLGETTIRSSNAFGVFQLFGASDITLCDLAIQSTATGTTAICITGEFSTGVQKRVTVTRCRITGSTNNAVRFPWAVEQLTFTDNIVEDCASGVTVYAPTVASGFNSTQIVLSRNRFRRVGSVNLGILGGVNFIPSTTTRIFMDANGKTISNVFDVEISGNQIRECAQIGPAGPIPIEVTSVTNMRIANNTIDGPSIRGISTGFNVNVSITGNTIRNQDYYAVELNGGQQISIVGNTVENCETLATDSVALDVAAPLSDVVIANNVYFGSGRTATTTSDAIALRYARRVRITGNIFTNWQYLRSAIRIGGGEAPAVQDCVVEGNTFVISDANTPLQTVNIRSAIRTNVVRNTVRVNRNLVAGEDGVCVITATQDALSSDILVDGNHIQFSGTVAAAPLTAGVGNGNTNAGPLPGLTVCRNTVVDGPRGLRLLTNSTDLTVYDNETSTCASADVIPATVSLARPPLGSPRITKLLDTNGADVLSFTAGTNPATNVNIRNHASTPTIESVGAAADVPLAVVSKGTSSIFLSPGNTSTVQLSPVASAVNFVRISGGTAGNPTIMLATGSDTNVSLNLTTKGTGTIQANGAPVVRRNVQTVTAATTLGSNGDYVVFISGANGAVTLPTAVGNTGRYTLKNIHTANKTVSTTSSQTIDGGTLTILPGDSVDVISDGTNWRIV